MSPTTGPRNPVTSGTVTFVVAGQSNADGVDFDADWDSEPLQAGVSIQDKGVDLAAYPDGVARHCGPLPYLAGYALAEGATTVRIMREATNGANIVACDADIGTIISRLVAKGWTPDYWVLAQGEAETLNPAQSPADEYEGRLDHYCRRIWAFDPECRVVLPTLLMRTADYGGAGASADYPLIVAAQIAVAARYPGRVLLVDTQSPSVLDMADTVHASAGIGGGHDVCMSRLSDLWSQ